MGFFDLSDGSNAAQTGTDYEVEGGNLEPIPAGTRVKAMIDEADWKERQNEPDLIELRWTILAPDEHKNRKLYQKVRVEHDDPKKADKARRMLAAIDANAGGELAKLGERPTPESMAKCLFAKPMVLLLDVWEMETEDGKHMTGNWVKGVSGKQADKGAPAKATDDDIPF